MKTFLLTMLTTALLAPLAANAAMTTKAPGFANMDAAVASILERRKKRVPGGSGCDDPEDIREHPECRR